MIDRLPARIAAKIQIVGECWIWIGARVRSGYGSCWHRGSARQAHVVVWEIVTGKVLAAHPRARELDHTCRDRACVNPAHLQRVTRSVNNSRSTCWHHLHKTP